MIPRDEAMRFAHKSARRNHELLQRLAHEQAVPVTAEEIIADHEQDLRDIREGIQEALFIVGAIALFVWGCWVFV